MGEIEEVNRRVTAVILIVLLVFSLTNAWTIIINKHYNKKNIKKYLKKET